ncbi:MAG: virulence factor [Paracoccaceae bacterium]
MARIVIVGWRDIPAQVVAGAGRRAAKRPLPERFEQAIDRCAMRVGARGSDAYLADWRRSEPYEAPGEDAAAAEAEAARLEAEYDAARLAALIANDGWEPAAAGRDGSAA